MNIAKLKVITTLQLRQTFETEKHGGETEKQGFIFVLFLPDTFHLCTRIVCTSDMLYGLDEEEREILTCTSPCSICVVAYCAFCVEWIPLFKNDKGSAWGVVEIQKRIEDKKCFTSWFFTKICRKRQLPKWHPHAETTPDYHMTLGSFRSIAHSFLLTIRQKQYDEYWKYQSFVVFIGNILYTIYSHDSCLEWLKETFAFEPCLIDDYEFDTNFLIMIKLFKETLERLNVLHDNGSNSH